MMLYEKIKNYSDKKFKRALGIPVLPKVSGKLIEKVR